jgi:hypothetical protein
MGHHFGTPATPPGWVALAGTLSPSATIAGYAARGEFVSGRCQQHECKRSCIPDLERLIKRGLGNLTLAEYQAAARCNVLGAGGCGLTWTVERRHGGLTLGGLARWPQAAIRYRCPDCKRSPTIEPMRLVQRLRDLNAGGSDTLVVDLKKPDRPCACGKKSWLVEVAWPSKPRAAGDRAGSAP